MPKGFFVTGTDTNVGKTVLSALLCAGLNGIYWKPIQTGASEGTDRQAVMSWLSLAEKDSLREVYVFDDPVSPHLAAERSGVEIDLERVNFPEMSNGIPLVVEGAGGVLVPINRREVMTDLMHHLRLPVVLAARSTLGTINHTLLTVRCLREAAIPLLGVVLIGPPNSDNKDAIEHFGNVPVIGEIPPLATINKETLGAVFASSFIRDAFK